MISSALAIRDLRALRTVDPELTLRLLSPGYEVLDITSDVAEAHSNEQQEQEESAFSIAKIRIVSQALAHIIAMVGSAVSLVGRLLIRLLANPYVAGALAIATVGFSVFKWIKNKISPVDTYPALAIEQQQEYLQSLGYPAGTICVVNSKKRATNTFTDVEAAALWLKENKHGPEAYKIFNLENTMKNIEKAIKSGNHYYGMGWRRVNG